MTKLEAKLKYCGIDLHSNNCLVSAIDEEDHDVAEKRVLNDLFKIIEFIQPWRAEMTGVVIESNFNWYWLVDESKKILALRCIWPTPRRSRNTTALNSMGWVDESCPGSMLVGAANHWQFYQARNIREEIAKTTLMQLKLQTISAPAAAQTAIQAQITLYEGIARDQKEKKEALKLQAERDQRTYDALNFRDGQFDLSDAAIAIAISLLAVSSLTQLSWLYLLALLPLGFGVLMGVSGLIGWNFHPDGLVKLLNYCSGPVKSQAA